MQILQGLLPIVIFVVITGFLFLRVLKPGRFMAAMFGAPIRSSIGEVSGTGGKIMSVTLKVCTLDGAAQDKAVGLELVAKSFASYQMLPISLSSTETQKLISLLQQALN
jgi:hypothetical protein